MITQIGSVPFLDIGKALAYSWKHDVPFLPELVLKGESMFDYIKNPGKLRCLEKFKRMKYSRVKVQSVGPASLIVGGYEERNAIERVKKNIYMILEELDAEEIFLFLDEPFLGKFKGDFKKLWTEVFNDRKITSGIHCCGEMDWEKLFSSDIEMISFDASKYDITKTKNYRNGKRIAWGVKKVEDVRDFRVGDLLTLPCGMGNKSFDVEREFEMLVAISNSLKG
jgi:hypothetical protein